MTTIQIVAVSTVGLWLLVLSFVTLLVVRQMSLITIRLSTAAPHSVSEEHGPVVGTEVDSDVLDLLGNPPQPLVLAFATGACDPCREFAETLDKDVSFTETIFLVLGEPDFTSEFVDELPVGSNLISDPLAPEIASRLKVDLMPFAVRVEGNRVNAKAHLRTKEDLDRINRVETQPALEVVAAGQDRQTE